MSGSDEQRSGLSANNSNDETPRGTADRSGRSRRRGRRRGVGKQDQQRRPAHQREHEEAASQDAGAEVNEPIVGARVEPPAPPQAQQAPRPRRRNSNPRRKSIDITGEGAVRADAPVTPAPQPERRWAIGEEFDDDGIIAGCPMLTRTRLGMPFRGGQHMPRCSAGWTIHDEDEVLLCMHTPTRNQCWKEHPEYLEGLVERLRPIIESELKDQVSS